jgi:tetratricopeptide (TPR) repeat protein
LELGPGTDRERFDLLALRSKLNARLGDVDAEEADVSALEEIALRVDSDAVGAALLRRIDLAHRKANRERECEAIDRLRTLALATGSDRLFAAADEAQSKRAFQDGEIGSAIESAKQARIRYEHIGDEAASARVTGFAAHASSEIYCNSAEWERLAYEALELAERVGDAETRLSALFHAASVACKISVDPPRAAELCRAALAIAVEIGDRVAEVRCHEQLGKTFFNDESYEEAAKQFTVAQNLCESLGLTEPLGNILCNLGAALSLNGVPSALDYLKRATDEGLKKDAASTAALIASLNLMISAWWRGDLDLMSTTLERCTPLVEKRTDLGYTIAAHDLNVGRLLRCRHEFDASARELEKLAETLEDARSRGDTRLTMMLAEVYDDLALTYLGSGRLADARLALNRNAEVSRKAAKQQWTLLEHHWIDACVSRAQGRLGDARLALGRAHTIYCGRLDKIVDPGVRASYEARPVNRALRLALEHDQWPAPQSPCVIAFPDPASASEAMRTSSAIA